MQFVLHLNISSIHPFILTFWTLRRSSWNIPLLRLVPLALWTWLISCSWENRERFICLTPCISTRSHSAWWWKLNTQHHLYSSSLADVPYQPVDVPALIFSENERCRNTNYQKWIFLEPELPHYSSWLLLALWIRLCVPELVNLSLSGVGPWQMCQYGCRSSVLGERHLNSPWCITLAATNLAELSSKSSYFPLPLTICFLS